MEDGIEVVTDLGRARRHRTAGLFVFVCMRD